MGLSAEDRGALARSLIGPDYTMSATRAVRIADALAASPWLDKYVARHVRAALTEAAEQIESKAAESEGHWIWDEAETYWNAARIVRNLSPDG